MQKLEEIIVEKILGKEARAKFLQGKIPNNDLIKYSKIISKLSSFYVENKKEKIFELMKDESFVKSYALYYLPINFYKAEYLFSIIKEKLGKKENIDFLDFGCGPATGALSFCKYKEGVNYTLFDTSSEMLKLGKSLLKSYSPNSKINIIKSIDEVKKQKYDVICLLNTVNEFNKDNVEEFFDVLSNIVKKQTIIIIMEPALKSLSRNLMELRNEILEKLKFNILYPCFCNDKCPMLKEEGDWCHQELLGFSSSLVSQIDDLTGFNKHKIKFSSLILENKEKEENNEFLRVVSIPQKTNQGLIFKACGNNFYEDIKISKALLKENKELKKIKFFDAIKKNILNL